MSKSSLPCYMSIFGVILTVLESLFLCSVWFCLRGVVLSRVRGEIWVQAEWLWSFLPSFRKSFVVCSVGEMLCIANGISIAKRVTKMESGVHWGYGTYVRLMSQFLKLLFSCWPIKLSSVPNNNLPESMIAAGHIWTLLPPYHGKQTTCILHLEKTNPFLTANITHAHNEPNLSPLTQPPFFIYMED